METGFKKPGPRQLDFIDLGLMPALETEASKKLVSILTSYPCLSINCDIARQHYSLLRAKLYDKFAPKRKKGRSAGKKRIEEWKDPTTSKELQIQENDLWISAIALAHNLILVTADAMTPIVTIAGNDIEFENWVFSKQFRMPQPHMK